MANKDFTETLAKYIAGLADADGSLAIGATKFDEKFVPNLTFKITQAKSIDKDFKLMNYLFNNVKLGRLHICTNQKGNRADICEWAVSSRNELEIFLPRIIKYLVIKGTHFDRTLTWWRNIRGFSYDLQELQWFRKNLKQSRADTGSLKPKNYPSAAWLAGYVDGDGCLYLGPKQKMFTVSFHKDDMVGPLFIQKAFGGNIYEHLWKNSPDVCQYRLTLGGKYKLNPTGEKFIRYILPHLHIKKHNAELLLAMNQQRLSEKAPTGEATV